MKPPRLIQILLLVAVLAVAGCGSDDSGETTGATSGDTAVETTGPTGDETAPGPDAETAATDGEVQVFFTTGEQFAPVDRTLPGPGGSPEPAVRALLRGPTAAEAKGADEAQSAIPAGTGLQSLEVTPSGTAVVRLDPKFTAGVPLAAEDRTEAQQQELDARVGQVVYTLTEYDDVKAAKVLSGGVTVAPGVNRGDFEKPSGGPPPVLKPKGKRKAGTKWVQERLAQLTYLPANAVDGVYGYQTQQAVMAFQSWEGLGRDGVAGPITKGALRTAKRPQKSSSGPSRRIEVYRERGVALLISDDRLKRAIHVSSGAPGTDTPSGSYSVFRKELQSWSVPFSVWLPYASYFNNGIAFHEYPDVPPYPASHGCVRVPAPEAKRVYGFATIGTAVVVY